MKLLTWIDVPCVVCNADTGDLCWDRRSLRRRRSPDLRLLYPHPGREITADTVNTIAVDRLDRHLIGVGTVSTFGWKVRARDIELAVRHMNRIRSVMASHPTRIPAAERTMRCKAEQLRSWLDDNPALFNAVDR